MGMIRRNIKCMEAKKNAIPENKSFEEAEVPELPFSMDFDEKQYTKTEINRMSTAELKQMAFDKGVENANAMTGTELKKYFINLFAL